LNSRPIIDVLLAARCDEHVQTLDPDWGANLTPSDAPQSWKMAMKVNFLRLPPDMQRYFLAREKECRTAIHEAFRDRSDAQQKLAAVEAKLAAVEDQRDRALAKLKQFEEQNVEAETAA
jgi:hypothetical protein